MKNDKDEIITQLGLNLAFEFVCIDTSFVEISCWLGPRCSRSKSLLLYMYVLPPHQYKNARKKVDMCHAGIKFYKTRARDRLVIIYLLGMILFIIAHSALWSRVLFCTQDHLYLRSDHFTCGIVCPVFFKNYYLFLKFYAVVDSFGIMHTKIVNL